MLGTRGIVETIQRLRVSQTVLAFTVGICCYAPWTAVVWVPLLNSAGTPQALGCQRKPVV